MSAAAVNGYGRRYRRTSRLSVTKIEQTIERNTKLNFPNRKQENSDFLQQKKANIKSIAVKALLPVKIVALLAAIFACLWSPLKFHNEYLRSSSFEKITVSRGESLQDIAGRYTADPEKQESLMDAIAEVNVLPKGEPLPVGWKLLIPVIKQN